MKKPFFIASILFSIHLKAQISKVELQASGLTCSMCSNSIYKALKTLEFVQDVKPDIKTSSFNIVFKPGSKVNFDQLKKKVEDAGFFVSKFIASINFSNTQVSNDGSVAVDEHKFRFSNIKGQALNGNKEVKIIDKGFVSAKEYKKNAVDAIGSGGSKVYNASVI